MPILERFEIPVAGWQVYRTASELHTAVGDMEMAGKHRANAVEAIMKLADSFEQGDPLIESFLTAPPVRRVLERSASA